MAWTVPAGLTSGARKLLSGVYSITSPSGKQYVGSAKSMRHRWSAHCSALRRGDHHSPQLQRAFNKYGEDSLRFEVLLVCAPEHLTMYEQAAIDAMGPAYNVLRHARSPLGVKRSEQTKEKIAASKRGKSRPAHVIEALRKANFGKVLSAEHRAKISAFHRGRKKAPEHVAKVAAANRGRKMQPEHVEQMRAALTGRKLAPEHAQKARTSSIGLKRSPETLERMSAAAKVFCEANRELVTARVRAIHVGRKRSPETRAKISAARRATAARKKAANG